MGRLLALALAMAVLPGLGCPEHPVCDPNPSDNTCSGDGDCVMAYCAPDCAWCPMPFSRAQVDSTWCLTVYGGTTPIAECLEGRDSRCAGVVDPVCATRGLEAWCNAGKCDLRAPTP
ncbi:MAG: hypothetical protein HY907_05220 [Deltaproteobacteria bacterium]|nr:hypothetical protein [Deltaproteobacteria bacterium]